MMTKKTILTVMGIFILILALAASTAWRITRWKGGIEKEAVFKSEIFKFPNLRGQLSASSFNSEAAYQEFISPDGKLKVKYPLGWMTTSQKDILDALTPEVLAKKYNLQTLLLAGTVQEKESGQLVIYRGNFNLSIGKIIEEIRKTIEGYSWEMKIIKSDVKEKEGTFEARYQTTDQDIFRSKEKILAAGEGEAYIISALAPEESWPDVANDIDKILDSAIMIEQY